MRAHLRLAWLVLRSLTWRRLWNALQVWASYRITRLVGRPVHWGLPIALGIEPTTACNLRCPQCVSGLRAFTRPTGRLKPEVFYGLIDELAPTTSKLILYFQGEPYLNPHLFELVRYATGRGLFVGTSTNAHFLTPQAAQATVQSGLQHLVVSVDGATQASYSQYRKEGELATVLEGIRNLVAAKRAAGASTPFVELQFIVFRHNEHEIGAMRALARELGVDKLALKTAQIYDTDGPGAELIPTQARYRRYTLTAAGFRLKAGTLNHCWKLWSGAEVTWDGRVLPCCFDKDARYLMGTYPEASFGAIWRGDAYRAFRRTLTQRRGAIDICQNCTEGTRVWA